MKEKFYFVCVLFSTFFADNWAMLFAQKLALENELPLHVCYCVPHKYLDASIRYYNFLLDGLKEVEKVLQNLNINFHLLHGEPDNEIVDFITKNNFGALVCDFIPLKVHSTWVKCIGTKLPKNCLYFQVINS